LQEKANALHAGGTVNANDLAVDPLAVLGSEEADDAGNVDGLADAVERRPGFGVLLIISLALQAGEWEYVLH